MSQNENFGIMDQGYFVPRSEILSWVNDLLKVHLTKIEELGSGAVYCQILDAIHPGKVAMAKVNWKAKVDYEFLNNYKILQTAFDKFGIKRYIDVERLSKAKYQDNLQFIQWMKRYYEVNRGEKCEDYNAEERRGNIKMDFGFAQKIVVPKNFNAGGQIIPKPRANSKEKRETGTSAQKDSAKRLASPQNFPRVKSSQEKKTILLERNQSNKDLKRLGNSQMPPNPHQKLSKIEPKQEEVEQSLSIRPNRASLEQLQTYKKKVRDLQSKLQMIAEIAQTKDQAEIKMKLIEEVLSIGLSKLSKTSDIQSPQSQRKKKTYKPQQQYLSESLEVSESIPQHQNYTFKGQQQVSLKGSRLESESSKMNESRNIKVQEEQQQAF